MTQRYTTSATLEVTCPQCDYTAEMAEWDRDAFMAMFTDHRDATTPAGFDLNGEPTDEWREQLHRLHHLQHTTMVTIFCNDCDEVVVSDEPRYMGVSAQRDAKADHKEQSHS